ncbi:DUF2264 domain-containing protein [Streptomyces sp. NPDC090108]|uniref:DUF2264 domain-containing protein n=1 Tax=Streptomyces sp. NPDC090108 TaxID=3365947 RepID=UPI00380DF250
MHLPADDRSLSPYTGFTRAHWEAAADALLAAVEPWATPDRALYHLPGDHVSHSGRLSDGLEGYARTFLLAAFRRDETVLGRYAEGLATGPGDAWPPVTDRSQPLVEAASVALGLRLTRPLLWDRLDQPVRERTAAWLTDALTAEPWPNNWELFPVTVGGFLQDIGHTPQAARAAVDRGLERIENWYEGGGWYTDGDGRKFDHYNGWALHLYPVLHAWLAGDAARLDRYGTRLRAHLGDHAHLFGADGAPMRQGRSLTYRFATAAPLWLGALTGHTPLSPGETRRLASGALRHFLDRGAVDARGLLSLGWLGPDESVVQSYSGPASPYWASKGFLGLLLPPDHEVWTATEEPGPVERADLTRTLRAPNWLLQSTRSDGVVRLHNHGSEDVRWDPYYTRLAYSTATAPAATYDNSVTVGGSPDRADIVPLGVGEGWAASRHTVRDGITVTSVVLARGAAEVRAHLVSGAAPGTPVRISGWAAKDGVRSELLPVTGLSDPSDGSSGAPADATDADADADADTGIRTESRTGAGLLGVTGEGDTLFVALARLTADPDPEPLDALVAVRSGGAGGFEVRWSGGGEVTVRLTAAAAEITVRA